MNFVIATGCLDSGWEIVLPVLLQSGLQSPDNNVADLVENCIYKHACTEENDVSQTGSPEPELSESLASVLTNSSIPPLLLADSKNLLLTDFWAKKFPKARFLLFYNRAETVIGYAISRGFEPRHVLNNWLEGNRKLLDFHRHHRQNSILFDAEGVSNYPTEFAAACQHFGIEMKLMATPEVIGSEVSSLEKIVATGFLESQSEIMRMQLELEASSQPLGAGGHAETYSPEELINSLMHYHANRKSLQQQLRETQQSLGNRESAYQQQIEKVEKDGQLLAAQLDEARGQLRTLESSQLEAARQNEQLLRQVQQLETAQQDTVLENELLITQLHQVQEELECYFFKWQGHLEVPASQHKGNSVEREKPSESSRFSKLFSSTYSKVCFWKILKASRRDKNRIQRDISLLRASGLFDEGWYLSVYPDVATAGVEPIMHYIQYGAAEGRHPSPFFDTQAYLQANPDVGEAKTNPLLHYVKFGKAEGRITRMPEMVSGN